MTPSLGELTRVFLRIGAISFGGPAAQIALMHRELVDQRDWLDEDTFLRALSFTMLLPGPEAMQLATYAGWRLHGTRGGLIAGLLFVLPGAAVILALSLIYATYGDVQPIEALFFGVKAAVVAIVLEALLKVSRRALRRPGHWVIAGLAFLGIFAFALPFPLIIAAAALWGAWTGGGAIDRDAGMPHPGGTGRTIAIWLALWLAPIGLLWISGAVLLTEIAVFFSKLAVVTFGGAYAVLAYMTQEVVQIRGWLTTPEMMDGLGLAETTPGPLILVTQFVGTLTGYGAGGIPFALAAGAVTLWVTFTPCFLWIFAGAPYLEWISARPRLTGALSAITAAVVGVVLNLSIWFAVHVIFREVETLSRGPLHVIVPRPDSLDPLALLLSVASAGALILLRWPLLRVLGLVALAGLLLSQWV